MNRRGFLQAILAAAAGPAIVKAANLMPVFTRASSGLLLPTRVDTLYGFASGGSTLLTIDMITREALKILHDNLTFTSEVNMQYANAFRHANDVLMIRA